MKHRILLLSLLTTVLAVSCKNEPTKKEPVKIEAAYTFPIPKDWTSERISFPISFAPQIPFKGVEDLRFTPGWENVISEEHWSYAFVWWVDGKVALDTSVLNKYLGQYYAGLLGSNVAKRNLRPNELTATVANISTTKTEDGDLETYSGTIKMNDYLDFLHPVITLNCLVHKKDCNTHTAILIQISPQPMEHKVWKQLVQLEDSFTCNTAR